MNQDNPPDIQNLYVGQAAGVRLVAKKITKNEIVSYYLVSHENNVAYPINDSAAIIWECFRESIIVSDLIQQLIENYPGALSLEEDILQTLQQYHELGLIRLTRDQFLKEQFILDYEPEQGQESEKAQRLVDFCLGEFSHNPVLPCTKDLGYLNDKSILLLEAGPRTIQLSQSADLTKHARLDQKLIVKALIDQHAVIPAALSCWLVREDSTGITSNTEQGLHIAAVRPASRRHLVLVPSANRERYLGPNLQRQMEELRQLWVSWEKKTDTAWWGGALTGELRKHNKTRAMTRRETLSYYRDNPSDQVHLHLTELPSATTKPAGVELKSRFTKASAFAHKCLVLLPGNDIASGSSWYFCGNSVVLMPEPNLEHILFFEIKPWVHYVPLESNPGDILVKLGWVLDNPEKAKNIVKNAHERLLWLCGTEYLWACNEVLRRIASSCTQK